MARRGAGPASTAVIRVTFHEHVPGEEAAAVAATLRHLGGLTGPDGTSTWTLAVGREEDLPRARGRLVFLEREGLLRWREAGPG